jgi:hypothetical protein
MHAYGTEPRELALRLKKGLEDDIFLIIPYPSAVRMLQIDLERFQLYTSVEGMKELEERILRPPTEEQKRIFFEKENFEMGSNQNPDMREKIGFGMARKDLDWVSEEKRVK